MFSKSKKVLHIVALLVLILSVLLTLTACQKVEKKSYIDTGSNLQYTCSYNSESDTTYVVWTSSVQNPTIYNLTSGKFKFDLYNSGSYVRTTDFVNYEFFIEHGETSFVRFSFTAYGNIDAMSIVSWDSSYSSFWDTYKIWMIVFIVLLSLAVIIYSIVVFVQCLDLEDIFEFISNNIWLLISILPTIGIAVYSIVDDNWVPIAIAGGALVSFIILALFVHLIMYLLELLSGFDYASDGSSDLLIDDFNNKTVAELKEYCRDNEITGYSSLNKQQIIDLIMNNIDLDDENNEEETLNENKSKKEKKNSNKKIVSNKITFNDIAGLENVKESFREKVIMPFEHPELFEKYGKKSGGGILLYGLPGTGKTMFAEAASNEIDALFIPIKCSDIKSKWYGESEQKIKDIFNKAKKSPRSIIFFDEFEAIGAKRNDNSDNGNNDLVPEILAEMQGVGSSNSNSTIVVIAATNKPWSIDSAFLRPGRFDEKIYVPLPDYDARKTLFSLQLSKLPTVDIDYDYLSNITEGFNGADIKEFCERLKLLVIKQAISSNEEISISMNHVHIVEKIIKSSVLKDEIDLLKEFESNF